MDWFNLFGCDVRKQLGQEMGKEEKKEDKTIWHRCALVVVNGGAGDVC